jgi:glucose-1-phosphate thymidylyltransferase
MQMKGVILAGGTGSRLYPSTVSTNKHLLPVFDKPLIYFPLSTLLMAGISELVIVSDPTNLEEFERLLGFGERFGVDIKFAPQTSSNGIVGALQSAEKHIGSDPALVILGDNIYFGGGIGASLNGIKDQSHARIWIKQVSNPSEYGVITLNHNLQPVGIVEKPKTPASNMAITGLYYLPSGFIELIHNVKPSERNELEITSLLSIYLEKEELDIETLHRGTAWFDAGSPDRLFMSADFVRIIQERTGQIVGSPEEVAFRNGMISAIDFKNQVLSMPASQYRETLLEIVEGIN